MQPASWYTNILLFLEQLSVCLCLFVAVVVAAIVVVVAAVVAVVAAVVVVVAAVVVVVAAVVAVVVVLPCLSESSRLHLLARSVITFDGKLNALFVISMITLSCLLSLVSCLCVALAAALNLF